jgi:hypothetical protein
MTLSSNVEKPSQNSLPARALNQLNPGMNSVFENRLIFD